MMLASSSNITDFNRTTQIKNHLFSPNPKAGHGPRKQTSVGRTSSLVANLAVTDKLKTVLKKSPKKKAGQQSSKSSLKLSSLNPSKQTSEVNEDPWDEQEIEVLEDEEPRRNRF